MRHFILTLFLCLLTTLPALAQDKATSVTVTPDNVKELIKTLESDTARAEFLQNLKTLAVTTERPETQPESPATPLSEAIGINAQTDHFLQRYNTFLQSHNLNTSLVGRASLSLLSVVLTLLFWGVANKGITRLHNTLQRVKDRFHLTHTRFRLYTRLFRLATTLAFLCLLLYTNAVIWGVSGFGVIQSDTTVSLLKNVLNITLLSAFALGVWEVINIFIENSLRKNNALNNNRMRTVIPIIRNIAVVIFGSLFGLVLLSELGINIMPLLAGAGVIGIAIGFGAQTMVKNYIAGLTIILEDLMQVGDVVHIAGRRGTIEKISIRKVQIRSVDGNVHTIPFSEITVIENMTKDYSYYLLDINVSYAADPDAVMAVMRDVATNMRQDPDWQPQILDDLEVMGLDRFADSAIVIRARLRTLPGKQWDVGRAYNRRLKQAFAAHAIEIPFPQQTVHIAKERVSG